MKGQEVEMKDREEKIEMFRLAMVIADIPIDYETADLIYLLQQRLDDFPEKTDSKDIISIKQDWAMKWEEYYNNNEL